MIRTTHLAPNAIRITHLFPQADNEPPAPNATPDRLGTDRPWLAHILLPTRTIPMEEARLIADEKEGCVCICTKDGKEVLREARPARTHLHLESRGFVVDIPNTELRLERTRTDHGISLSLTIAPGEGFYGWGEWFDAFRRERGTIHLKAQNALAQKQDRATYSALPFFLSSRGYGFWLLNSHASTWRIDRKAGRLDIAAEGPGADYIVIHGPALRDIITTYTELTGRPPLIPRWAFGLFATGYPQEDQQTVLDRLREHREHHIPLDALILDYHWEERFHNLQWQSKLFPDPTQFIADLKTIGIKLGLILSPILNRRNRRLQRFVLNKLAHNVPRGLERADWRALPEYDKARREGYLAHAKTNWWFGEGGMIDFSNPAAATWWNERLRPLYQQGVSFIKNDAGESLPADGHSALGMDGSEYHNLYGFFYSRALYEGQAALDERRPFVYARTVWVGSQRYPAAGPAGASGALFLGDQKPTFPHIRNTMRAGLNLSLLGFAYWTADVFGLDGKTTLETHMRYAQWALMAPVARYFWRPSDVDGTRLPWSHGAAAEDNFRTYADLRYRLLPYYYALAWQAHETGLPILRPLLLEFQEDTRFADCYDQMLLGDRVLLAPVVEAGATSRKIALPEGFWYDFWAEQAYEGGVEITYTAPLERLPMLIRGGSILPMGPSLPRIGDDHRFGWLKLHCYPPYPAACLLYDDDGLTRAYQRGEFALTRVGVDGDADHTTIRIMPALGSFPGQLPQRAMEIVLHRASKPGEVRINGELWERWTYQAERRCVSISFDSPVRQGTIVEVRAKSMSQ
jgi:alpha-glucosidase (family GH31 glycosyl hydrolase)